MLSRAFQSCIGLLLLVVVFCGSPSSAQSPTSTVGGDGEVLTVLHGSYGDLFPNQGVTDATYPVLALDILRPGATVERLLVRGTEGPDVEDSASLVFEDESKTLFILWQTKVNIHSYLNLTSYDADGWAPVAEIWGSPFGWKTSPQLTVTRDLFKVLDESGKERISSRTVLHVIWSEEGADGMHTFYSPVFLVAGSYSGTSPVYDLSEAVRELGVEEGPLVGTPPVLSNASRIQAGRNSQTVAIAFPDPWSRKLVTLELEVLPGELGHLADRLGHQIVDLGRNLFPAEQNRLAGKLGHQIVDLGRKLGLHPGLTAYAAAVVEDEVMNAAPDEPLEALADRLGHQIVDLGARMTGRGVDRTLTKSGYQVLDVLTSDPAAATEAEPPHLIRISAVSSRALPSVEGGLEAMHLFLSRTGVDVIVAWPTERGLSYLESRAHGWSRPFEVRVGENGVTSLERAMEMLRLRADGLHHEPN